MRTAELARKGRDHQILPSLASYQSSRRLEPCSVSHLAGRNSNHIQCASSVTPAGYGVCNRCHEVGPALYLPSRDLGRTVGDQRVGGRGTGGHHGAADVEGYPRVLA